jgi:hypothetical protein
METGPLNPKMPAAILADRDADRAYLNGFFQACREFSECLAPDDAKRMDRRCTELQEAYRRNCASWGIVP